MNRFNFGNVVTNGMQVLSVGGTTASGVFRDRADSALTNMTKEERAEYGKYKADLIRDEMANYKEKENNKKLVNSLIENSEQAKEINKRIQEDVNFSKMYGVRFWDKSTGRTVSIENIIKNKNKEGGNE